MSIWEDPNKVTFLLMCTMILLPLVPAYLLFKILPSSTDVTGPWQGLNIKLGGAFAGYFLVVLLIFSAYHQVKQIPPPAFEVWDVRGSNLTGPNNQDLGPISESDFSTHPGWMQDAGGSDFHMYVYTRPGTGNTEYPVIHIQRGNQAADVNLDPSAPNKGNPIIKVDSKHHVMSVSNIVLKPIPSYDSSLGVVQLK